MSTAAAAVEVAVEGLDVSVYEIPTDAPESDGTLEWESTTIVVVEAHAGGRTGLGYTYGPRAIASFVADQLADVVAGSDALKVRGSWARMQSAIRNAGRQGVGAMAVSAVDNALWDLCARLLDLPLARLLGQVHERAHIYGSGGFCSYDEGQLKAQLGGWVEEGIPRVKMKVGREPARDRERVRWAREAIGDEVELMVDANGAYRPKEALAWASRFAERGISWLEEPVSFDDVDGLAFVRRHGPPGLVMAAGEYGWSLFEFQRLLECAAVDCVQPDVTRCGGMTNVLRADGLCKVHCAPLSAHCAPALSVHVVCACETAVHIEYFHDHVRIESMLFDGTLPPDGGSLEPDLSRPGNGLELKRADAARFAVA
ncbi:MAG: mandelate racemase [Actinomycetota bacterium]|nr:mandelate racemase [Actinomycetota bacterium]